MKSVKVIVGTNWSTSVPLRHMKYVCMDSYIIHAVENGNIEIAELLVQGKIKRKIVARNLRIEKVPVGTAFRIVQDNYGNETIQYLGTDVIIANENSR